MLWHPQARTGTRLVTSVIEIDKAESAATRYGCRALPISQKTQRHGETGGNQMKKALIVAMAILVLVTMAGCAPGPNELAKSPDDEGQVAGFWLGLWHGIIAPITFIVSLFSDNVHMYDVHNNGNWYNFGFLLGASIVLGGGGGGAGRRSACK
jgi:hypothetical protein